MGPKVTSPTWAQLEGPAIQRDIAEAGKRGDHKTAEVLKGIDKRARKLDKKRKKK
jgi:hypothetical protein